LALFYGRYLHQVLGVPVGLIHNACGGASAEAWMDRKVLESDPQFEVIIGTAQKLEARASGEKGLAKYEADLIAYDQEMAAGAQERGKNPQSDLPRPHRPPDPRDYMAGPLRPGNLFNGVLRPTIGYGIKGVIWYQGESNTRSAWLYRKLFPSLITEWRNVWG